MSECLYSEDALPLVINDLWVNYLPNFVSNSLRTCLFGHWSLTTVITFTAGEHVWMRVISKNTLVAVVTD